jgi:hypothetical protein
MRSSIFEARKDTKENYYLLKLDTNQQIIKILSNPNQ